MKITVGGTNFTGCNNRTCFAELWPQVDVTYIQEEKMPVKNDRQLVNSSIKDLLQSFKPPNVIAKDTQ